MKEPNVISRVVNGWRSEGATLNLGATAEELRLLEACLTCELPADVREYFSLVNGMRDGSFDRHFVSFWSIQRIAKEIEKSSRANFSTDPRDTPIADFMIDSWFIFLRKQSHGMSVIVDGASLELVSLTAFFERYENNPGSLCI